MNEVVAGRCEQEAPGRDDTPGIKNWTRTY